MLKGHRPDYFSRTSGRIQPKRLTKAAVCTSRRPRLQLKQGGGLTSIGDKVAFSTVNEIEPVRSFCVCNMFSELVSGLPSRACTIQGGTAGASNRANHRPCSRVLFMVAQF